MCIYFAKMTLCKLTGTAVLSPQTILFIYESFVLLETLHWYLKMVTPPPAPPPPPPLTEIHMIILNDQFTLTRQQRGNLNTRFRKLSEDGSTYAAIILAVSGLERMNWHHLISEVSQPRISLGDSLFQWFWWQSVSVVLVTVSLGLVTVCFSGSGDSLFHWVWWQSVSLGLVTVCFIGSGDSLVLCQHHEVEENELTSSGLGGSRSASWGWRECADLFWFGRFSVSILSLKRRSWHLLIWEVLCQHLKFEEKELTSSDLGGSLSASQVWREGADIFWFGRYPVSIMRLKRLSWYCHIWVCFSVSIVRLKRQSWHCLIFLGGTLSASQVSKNELIYLIWEVLCWHHEFEGNEVAYDMGGHSSVFLCLLDDLPFDQLLYIYTLYVLILCVLMSVVSAWLWNKHA